MSPTPVVRQLSSLQFQWLCVALGASLSVGSGLCGLIRASYDETLAVANGLLEGFPEVNHASPTSPDLLGMHGLRAQEQTTSPASMLQIQHFVLILWSIS